MKRAEFLALVLASVNFLKEKATTEEKAKLSQVKNPLKKDGCILGKMTGDSSSERAKELQSNFLCHDSESWEKDMQRTNTPFSVGTPNFSKEYLKTLTKTETGSYPLAAFEFFICMDGANTDDLVAYVKGEKETFEPTFSEV